MRSRATSCLLAAVVVLALATTVAGILGPGLVRQAREVYAPISKIKESQQSFEEWSKKQAWQEPAEPTLTRDQLDRFLALRKDLQQLEETAPRPRREPGDPQPAFKDVPKVMGGVSAFVSARFEAFRRSGMTTAEYHYLERLVYRRWLGALKKAGLDPAVSERVAREILEAGRTERDPPTAARLEVLAEKVRGRRPGPPEGVPVPIHELLLARAKDVEALAESSSPFGGSDPE